MKHLKTQIDWKSLSKRRLSGFVLIFGGLVSVFNPFFVGEWLIGLIGLVPTTVGTWIIFESFRKFEENYLKLAVGIGIFLVLLGFFVFFSPQITLSITFLLLSLILIGYGIYKIYYAVTHRQKYWSWEIFNGIFNILTAFLIWYFINANLGVLAVGITFGSWLLLTGWTLVFTPEKGFQPPDYQLDLAQHPDYLLKLEPNETVREMQESLIHSEKETLWQNAFWSLSILAGFFIIHIIRVDASWSLIGLISPFAALVGDILMALLIAIALVIPFRLLWRRVTLPIERIFWRRLIFLRENGLELTFFEYLLSVWLKSRLRFSLQLREVRSSLNYAFWQTLRIGLPLTAIFVGVNSIWGFSWYFNTENWASIVWQKATENKIDRWRKRLIEDVESNSLANGIAPEKIFAIEPEGVVETKDFSFLVLGDTGEGDPSQMVLRDQFLKLGSNEDVKFLVVSSDVIYPDGRMKDYERNFYLPFKGFTKPIYAIPGNHDWFDANEGFYANFLSDDAAALALKARIKEEYQPEYFESEKTILDERFSEIIGYAQNLRNYYGVKNGLQRAPFFELQTEGFSLIAVDTGILQTIDDKQKMWLESALVRGENNFKLVILGHPFFAGGYDQTIKNKGFAEIREILRRHKVDAVMGGDTHDFEFYQENFQIENQTRTTFHFVNGGGGAYLSLGTALDFPENPPTEDFAYYPRTDQVKNKLKAETPIWKEPFRFWADNLKGYPIGSEALSGIFDFNQAPFFQSFIEVKVEHSKNQIRFLLYGANGQLRWKDIQIGGQVKPKDKTDEDFVEFTMQLKK